MSPKVSQKVARLKEIVAERSAWREPLEQIKRMQQRVIEVEHILDGSWAQAPEQVSNAAVGQRLDAWRQQMSDQLVGGQLSELEQECLIPFLEESAACRTELVSCDGESVEKVTLPLLLNEARQGLEAYEKQNCFLERDVS